MCHPLPCYVLALAVRCTKQKIFDFDNGIDNCVNRPSLIMLFLDSLFQLNSLLSKFNNNGNTQSTELVFVPKILLFYIFLKCLIFFQISIIFLCKFPYNFGPYYADFNDENIFSSFEAITVRGRQGPVSSILLKSQA